jgi:hypothetical protein
MKKYKLEIELTDEGKLNIHAVNEGFTPIELLGLLSWKKDDIVAQIKGSIEPDTVSRKVIED